MNFENKVIIKPKSLLEQPELRQELFNKKRKIVDDLRPNELDFEDIYSTQEIEKDLKEIEKLEKIWEEEMTFQESYNKEIASLLEGVIVDQVESNNWLGENTTMVPASRHDDVKHGVDNVAIFKQNEESQYLGLGVDVTFASDDKVLLKKMDSIKGIIRAGLLPELKYFRDPETNEHKKITVPKIIVGARLSSAEKLVMLWGSDKEGKNKKLKEDPMQSKIILESLYQLKYFYEFALNLSQNTKEEKQKNNYEKIALNYAEMYNLFYDIYESKKELIEKNYSEVRDDVVYQTIAEYTKNTKKEEK